MKLLLWHAEYIEIYILIMTHVCNNYLVVQYEMIVLHEPGFLLILLD